MIDTSTTQTPQPEPLAAPDDDEVLVAAPEAREHGEFVGFVGCPKVGVLKVRVASKHRMMMRVACPRCREVHSTSTPMVREVRSGELVTLIEDGMSMTVGDNPTPAADESDPGSARRQVSDRAILEAMPEQDTPAIEIARSLGYTSTKATPLIRRIRAINTRAEAKHMRPPIVVTLRSGCPTLLRAT